MQRDWKLASSFNPEWTRRSVEALRLLEPCSAICDIGCGPAQAVKHLIPKTTKYLPCDLKKWTDDTEECDLGKNIYPDKSLRESDASLVLGVLEYLHNAKEVLRIIAGKTPRLVVSYHLLETHPARHPEWRSSLSRNDIKSALELSGHSIEQTTTVGSGLGGVQTLFLSSRTRAPRSMFAMISRFFRLQR
jgi:hypothetical protein